MKFNFSNPLNKNLSEADTGGCSYIIGFVSLELLRTFTSDRLSDQNSSAVQKTIRSLNKDSNLKTFLKYSQGILKPSMGSYAESSINVCMVSAVYKNVFMNPAGWHLE